MRQYINAIEALMEAAWMVASPAFQAWFGDSKVVDAQGAPLVCYHGAMRADRIARDGAFLPHKATSGPMSFFTDSSDVASGYAAGKPDTSLDPDLDWADFWEINGTRGLRRAWPALPAQTRAWISQNGWMVHFDEERQRYTNNPDEGELMVGADQWQRFLRDARGNGLLALWDIWYQGGALVGSEYEFTDILRAAGVAGHISFDHPHEPRAGVFPVYLSIQNPLDTSAIPRKVLTALTAASKKKSAQPRDSYGTDQWSKHIQDPALWITTVKDPAEGPWAWTSIPDWVTDTLRKLGYDGIKDTGGKMGGHTHVVWIPFDSRQVKSAVGNRGTFDPYSGHLHEAR